MKKITFKYRDDYSNWEWREQSCIVLDVAECKRIYGLDVDCDYEIVDVEDVDSD